MQDARRKRQGANEIKRWNWVLVSDPEGSTWVKVIYPIAGESGQHFAARSTRKELLHLYCKSDVTRVARLPDDEKKIKELQAQYHRN